MHVGIYRALRRGYYRERGLRLRVAAPSSTVDPLKLVAAGRADFGLADPIDVARLRARGRDVTAVMALVQRPLGGVIARRDSAVRRPRDLEGRRVGVTGVPSDDAVLDTVVRNDGGDPRRVRRVTIGFRGVTALAAGRIDAFVGFWPADAPQLEAAGRRARVFALDANGGPRYPGLVVFASRRTLARRPAVVRAFLAATAAGYREAIAQPVAALRDLRLAQPDLEGSLLSRQLAAYRPLFQANATRFGPLDPRALEDLASFLDRTGLVKGPVDPAALGTRRYLP